MKLFLRDLTITIIIRIIIVILDITRILRTNEVIWNKYHINGKNQKTVKKEDDF